MQFISFVTHSSLILSNQFPAHYNFSLCQQTKYKFFNLKSQSSMSHQHLFGQASQIFQTCRCHFQILGARRVTSSISHPRFWCGLCILLLSGTFCLVHVDWYIFLYVRGGKKIATIVLKILVSPIQNFVTWAVRHPRFLCLCLWLLAAFACLQVYATYHMIRWEIKCLPSFSSCLDVIPAAFSFTCEVTYVLHLRKLVVNCCFSILFY